MLYRPVISLLLSFSILLYSCSGYKEVVKSDKIVDNAHTLYLYVDENYYELQNIQDLETHYSAEAVMVDTTIQKKGNVTIYAYNMTIMESRENTQYITIDKTQIYKFSKTVRNSGKTLTIIGLAAIAIIIISVIIEHDENKMKIHPHE